jgi:hypothetical protein
LIRRWIVSRESVPVFTRLLTKTTSRQGTNRPSSFSLPGSTSDGLSHLFMSPQASPTHIESSLPHPDSDRLTRVNATVVKQYDGEETSSPGLVELESSCLNDHSTLEKQSNVDTSASPPTLRSTVVIAAETTPKIRRWAFAPVVPPLAPHATTSSTSLPVSKHSDNGTIIAAIHPRVTPSVVALFSTPVHPPLIKKVLASSEKGGLGKEGFPSTTALNTKVIQYLAVGVSLAYFG